MTTNRAIQFLRSVLPADPFQLCFLAGLVCLTIAPHLTWWPPADRADWSAKLNNSSVATEYSSVLVAAAYGFILASSAGYFLCFWPGKRTGVKVWLAVVLPAAASVVVTTAKFLSIRHGAYSVLAQVHGSGPGLLWGATELWRQGSGIHFTVLGIGFIFRTLSLS